MTYNFPGREFQLILFFLVYNRNAAVSCLLILLEFNFLQEVLTTWRFPVQCPLLWRIFFTSGSANNLIFSSMSTAMKEFSDQEVDLQSTFFFFSFSYSTAQHTKPVGTIWPKRVFFWLIRVLFFNANHDSTSGSQVEPHISFWFWRVLPDDILFVLVQFSNFSSIKIFSFFLSSLPVSFPDNAPFVATNLPPWSQQV